MSGYYGDDVDVFIIRCLRCPLCYFHIGGAVDRSPLLSAVVAAIATDLLHVYVLFGMSIAGSDCELVFNMLPIVLAELAEPDCC